MIVITVARKPLSGSVASNVLEHGTGGLNIDGARITIGDVIDPQRKSYHQSGNGKVGSGGVYEGGYSWKYTGAQQPRADSPRHDVRGRWPSNLILEHLPGCRCAGEQKIRGRGDRGPSGPRHSVTYAQDTYSKTYKRSAYQGPGGEDGIETIPAWECEPNCPMADLNEQSGEGYNSCTISRNHQGGLFGWRAGNAPGYTDKGGASRFFKQVGGFSGTKQVDPQLDKQEQDMDTKELPLFPFHEEELEDARASLERSEVTCTARWGEDLGRWKNGVTVQTPWGARVHIFAVDRRQGIDQHPYKELLTDRLRESIGDGPFELVYLSAPAGKVPSTR